MDIKNFQSINNINTEFVSEYPEIDFNEIIEKLNNILEKYHENIINKDMKNFNHLFNVINRFLFISMYVNLKTKDKIDKNIEYKINSPYKDFINISTCKLEEMMISGTNINNKTILEIKKLKEKLKSLIIDSEINTEIELKNNITSINTFEEENLDIDFSKISTEEKDFLFKTFLLDFKIDNLKVRKEFLENIIKIKSKLYIKQFKEQGYDEEEAKEILEDKVLYMQNHQDELNLFIKKMNNTMISKLYSRDFYFILQEQFLNSLKQTINKTNEYKSVKDNLFKYFENLNLQIKRIEKIKIEDYFIENENFEKIKKLQKEFNNYYKHDIVNFNKFKYIQKNYNIYYDFPLSIQTFKEKDSDINILHIKEEEFSLKLNIKFTNRNLKQIDNKINSMKTYNMKNLDHWTKWDDIFRLHLLYSKSPMTSFIILIENILNSFKKIITPIKKNENLEKMINEYFKYEGGLYDIAFPLSKNNNRYDFFNFRLKSILIEKNVGYIDSEFFFNLKYQKNDIFLDVDDYEENQLFEELYYSNLNDNIEFNEKETEYNSNEFLLNNQKIKLVFYSETEKINIKDIDKEIFKYKIDSESQINFIDKLNINVNDYNKEILNSEFKEFFIPKNIKQNNINEILTVNYILYFIFSQIEYSFYSNKKEINKITVLDVSSIDNNKLKEVLNEDNYFNFNNRKNTLNVIKNLIESKSLIDNKIFKKSSLIINNNNEEIFNNKNDNLNILNTNFDNNKIILNIRTFLSDTDIKEELNKKYIYGDINILLNNGDNINIFKESDFLFEFKDSQIDLIDKLKDILSKYNIKEIIYLAFIEDKIFDFEIIKKQHIFGAKYLLNLKESLELEEFIPLIINNYNIYKNLSISKNNTNKQMIISNLGSIKEIQTNSLYPLFGIYNNKYVEQKSEHNKYINEVIYSFNVLNVEDENFMPLELLNIENIKEIYNPLDINSSSIHSEKIKRLLLEDKKELERILILYTSTLKDINEVYFTIDQKTKKEVIQRKSKHYNSYTYGDYYISNKNIKLNSTMNFMKLNILSLTDTIYEVLELEIEEE